MRPIVLVLALAACTRPNDSLSTGGGSGATTSGSGGTNGGSGATNGGSGGTNDGSVNLDLSTRTPDLAGIDLLGADFAGAPAHDLASPASDLSQAGGTVAIGGACAFSSGGNDCTSGAACVARRDTLNGGVCLKRCNGDGDCPAGFVGNLKNVS